MTTTPTRQLANPCQCADPGCPVCHGHCQRSATTNLVRVDMEDITGTEMCAKCADDALESGLFRTRTRNHIQNTTLRRSRR